MPNSTKCPKCESTNLIRQTGDDEPSFHYGRLKCANCHKFITWLRDPSTTLTTIQRNAAIIEIFKHSAKLSNWEITFPHSIKEKRYLTEKQQNRLNIIGQRVLGVQICAESKKAKTPYLMVGSGYKV
jgi:phage FluMu protein Com